MISKVAVTWCLLTVVLGAEDRWIWGDNRGRDGLRGEHTVARPLVKGNRASASTSAPLFQSAGGKNVLSDDPGEFGRYEIFEGGNGPGGPNELPHRPPIRPPTQYPGPRPGLPPPPPPLPPKLPPKLPPGPPPPGTPVLTGPVPSWERPPPPKNGDPTSFDTCKCVNSFNCKSPGLQFGSCDVGKSYCCYNNPGFGVYQGSGGPGAFGNKEAGPAVLAGPGGPIDKLRPDFPGPLGRPFPDEPFYPRPPPPGPLPYDDDVINPRLVDIKARRGKAKA
ncbi:cleavage and polyadenylation specificity factor subunit 6-like [Macrosteles quadrilineatus]|uniref:cleavage and polyadenylation specificity factor subunit 6-like n=1 Tax=Macrosteles quadrilineatus TaxID=74068 RepID=UPI0023E12AE1|nr:cleavage and polyadenylation specificity factor subunit 6-like [Macrosteles quadrilineatus]